MNILELRLDQIEAGRRLRAVDEDQARLIGLLMKEEGQQTPIEVRENPAGSARPYRLVAGAHRYRGAQLFELATVAATLFVGSDLQAQLREIDENLIRHELTALDRAVFLAERQDVYEKLHPETRKQARLKRGKDVANPRSANFAERGSEDETPRSANLAERAFSVDAAQRLGWSERTIQASIALAKAIAPEVRAYISGSPLADNGSDLQALGKLPPDQQIATAKLLIDPQNRRAANVAQAIRMVRNEPEPNDLERDYRALMNAWRKAPAADRGRFIEFLVAEKAVTRLKPRPAAAKGEAA